MNHHAASMIQSYERSGSSNVRQHGLGAHSSFVNGRTLFRHVVSARLLVEPHDANADSAIAPDRTNLAHRGES